MVGPLAHRRLRRAQWGAGGLSMRRVCTLLIAVAVGCSDAGVPREGSNEASAVVDAAITDAAITDAAVADAIKPDMARCCNESTGYPYVNVCAKEGELCGCFEVGWRCMNGRWCCVGTGGPSCFPPCPGFCGSIDCAMPADLTMPRDMADSGAPRG